MLTKKDSTIETEQASSLPNSSSFMLLFSHRKRSSSHPLSRTSSVEEAIGDDVPDVATASKGFVPGLDFNQQKYDEKDAGARIPSVELASPRLFTPRNKSLLRAASAEAGITLGECHCEENKPAGVM